MQAALWRIASQEKVDQLISTVQKILMMQNAENNEGDLILGS